MGRELDDENSKGSRWSAERLVEIIGSWVSILSIIVMVLGFIYSQVQVLEVYSDMSDLIASTEKRLDDALGRLSPKSAYVETINRDAPGVVTYQVNLLPMNNAVPEGLYSLKVVGQLQIRVTGSNGLLIGYNVKYDGPIRNTVSTGPDDEPIGSFVTSLSNFEPQAFSYDKRVTVTERFGARFTVSITGGYYSCNLATKKLKRLLELEDGKKDSYVYIQPIFERIQEQPEPAKFRIKLVSGSVFPCEKYVTEQAADAGDKDTKKKKEEPRKSE